MPASKPVRLFSHRTLSRILFLAGNTRSLIANRGDLIRALQTAQHEVHALVPEHDFLPEIKELDIGWRTVGLRRSGANPLADAVSVLELKREISKIRPDKVFAYTIKPIVYGVPAARWAGVAEVYAMITGMGYLFTGETTKQRILRRMARALYRNALKRVDGVFFQNPDDKRLFSDLGILPSETRAVLVNGSGVNLEAYPYMSLLDGPPVFLVIARLLQDKGIAEFVQAAEVLKSQYPNAKFQVLGPHDPGLPHSLPKELIDRWVENGAVEFLGHQADVRAFIAKAHVIVLPSYREGTPRSILEAMSMGRPVVTSDAPGCRETVEVGKNGYLVGPRTVEPLAEAMERFIKDPQSITEMGAASRRIAEAKYDVRLVNRHIMNTMGLT